MTKASFWVGVAQLVVAILALAVSSFPLHKQAAVCPHQPAHYHRAHHHRANHHRTRHRPPTAAYKACRTTQLFLQADSPTGCASQSMQVGWGWSGVGTFKAFHFCHGFGDDDLVRRRWNEQFVLQTLDRSRLRRDQHPDPEREHVRLVGRRQQAYTPQNSHPEDSIAWNIQNFGKNSYFTAMNRVLSGESDPSVETMRACWSKHAYTIFVQQTVGIGAGVRLNDQHWREAGPHFLELLTQLRPRK